MEQIKAKTILTKMKNSASWYEVKYNMNLYKGCSHGCIYCDSRSNCYQIEQFDQVKMKENALVILEKELSTKREKGVIGLGSMSDPYNPWEKEQELTRNALKLIAKYHYGLSLDTKSDLLLRDIDIIKEIGKHQPVIIRFTITTAKDELSKIIEPGVCPSSRRFSALKELNRHGIFAGIMMTPTLPFLTDQESEIKEFVRLAHEHKAKFIYTYFGMTLRENQRDYYYEKLDQYWPGLKEKYQERYANRYMCIVPNAKRLFQIFQTECEKYGILYRMEDIIHAYQKEIKEEQLTLF